MAEHARTAMFRSLPVLLIAAVVAVAAPGSKERDKAPLYHPTREGTKRVYENRVGDSAAEFAELVTKVEAKGGGFRVTTSREMNRGGTATIVTDVSANGVFRVANGGAELPEPLPLLKLPAKPGDTWEATRPGPPGEAVVTTTYTVGKEEEVEVPAGKFKAIPVEAK